MFAIEGAQRYFGDKMTKHLPKRVLLTRAKEYDVKKPYLGTGFQDDLFRWMREGELRDLVVSIERPAYLGRAQFNQALRDPSWFTWDEDPTLAQLHEKFLRDLPEKDRQMVIARRPMVREQIRLFMKAQQEKAEADLAREVARVKAEGLNEGRDDLTDGEYLAAKRRADEMRAKGEW